MSDDPLPGTARGELAPGHWRQVRRSLDRALICLDFDGTLAPIVDDPDQAWIHPEAPELLRRLAPQVLAVAVVTGRPVEQVLRLGRLDPLADALGEEGRLEIRGQYGAESWSSRTRTRQGAVAPQELADLRRRLPAMLREAGLDEAYVEEKGVALAVHTRRMSDPHASSTAVRELLAPVADDLGLRLEPGRHVVEVRASTADKGAAVDDLVAEFSPEAVLFAGDDLGDVAGFEAVERFRGGGGAGLLVCSGSSEESELAARADLVVDGPDGVVELLRSLAKG